MLERFFGKKHEPGQVKVDEAFLLDIAKNFERYTPGQYPKNCIRAAFARQGPKVAIVVCAFSRNGQQLRNRVNSNAAGDRWNEVVTSELISYETGKWSLSEIRNRLLHLRQTLGPNHTFVPDRLEMGFLRAKPLELHSLPAFDEQVTDRDLRQTNEVFLDDLRARRWMLPKGARDLASEAHRWTEDAPMSAGLLAMITAVKASNRNVNTFVDLNLRRR